MITAILCKKNTKPESNKSAMKLKSPAPFHRIATMYDQVEAGNPVLQWMRLRVQTVARQTFAPGSQLLEIGCGTGTDAVFLALQGHRVLALEPSEAMLRIAREKASAAGVANRVEFQQIAAENLSTVSGWHSFDGLFSNFGALNCLPNLQPFARAAAARLKPGAPALVVLMPRLCPWEIGYHLLHGRFSDAFRRWHGETGVLANLGGQPVRAYFFSASQVIAAFRPDFRLQKQLALGLLVPPPYLARIAGKHRLFACLAKTEARLATRWPFRHAGDHLIFQFVRR